MRNKRELSFELHQLKALLRRLHPTHEIREKVLVDMKRCRSGIKGEREVDYPLRFLDRESNLILHNLRIRDQMGYFQLDTLILKEGYLLILETKNWYGTIVFGESGQVTRIRDDQVEEGFPNPISQAKLQKHRLKRWLENQAISTIQIEFLVIISFPSTIIKSTSSANPIPKQVIHNSNLLFAIQQLDKSYALKKIPMKNLIKLADNLVKAHNPPTINILNKYRLSKESLIKGVICPSCSMFPMIRKRSKWYCPTCHYISTDAHLAAFNDYKLLIGDYVANRDIRDFLQVKSPEVVKYLLKKECFENTGRTSNRIYKLAFRGLTDS